MAKKTKQYKQLPGRGTGLANYYTLWLGPDHLLSIECNHFSEAYKRFYYNDIQSLTIHKTQSGKMWNAFLSTAGGLFLLWSLALDGFWAYFCLVGGSILFFFVLCNALLGPTCVCHIKTAVQIEKLLSLGRLRRALRTAKRLRPLIEQAQGTIALDELNAYFINEQARQKHSGKPNMPS